MDQHAHQQPDQQADQHQAGAAARAGPGALVGAMFLMATSAIGPGFITQTTVFTEQLGAAFAFAIVVSILVDIAVQLNVWRVVRGPRHHAQDPCDKGGPRRRHRPPRLRVPRRLGFNIGNNRRTAPWL